MKHSDLIKGIAIGLVIGLGVFFLYNFAFQDTISKEEAGNKVKEIYSLSNPNQNVRVSSITEELGLYKVIIKAGDQLREMYVTQNGKLLIRSSAKMDNLQSQLEETQNFIECLKRKDVKLYGIVNQTATQAQIQVLGGINFASQIYQSCGGNRVKTCRTEGIEMVPSIKYNNETLSGVKKISEIENFTGCQFEN